MKPTLTLRTATTDIVVRREGDHLRWQSRRPASPEVLARLRQHKEALLAVIGQEPPPIDYLAIYRSIAADTGNAEDAAACAWYYDQGHHDLPEELNGLERQCENLVRRGASETQYRRAVKALVERVREIHRLYEDSLNKPSRWKGQAG